MRLTISILAFCGQNATKRQLRKFEQFPVVIGRSINCHYVLDDPSRYISSNHATIAIKDGIAVVQDNSINGVFVNGASDAIGLGQSVAISDGDSIAIGDYTLRIDIESEPPIAVPDDVDDFDFEFGGVSKSTSDTPQKAAEDDTWADGLWDEPSAPPPGFCAEVSTPKRDDSPWNPGGHSPATEDPFAEILSTSSPNISSGSDWLDFEKGGNNAPGKGPDDITAVVDAEPDSVADMDSNALKAAIPSQFPSPAPPGMPKDASSGDLSLLLRAAGLDPAHYRDVPPEQLQQNIGNLLAITTSGIMELLQSRLEVKQAMRSDITQLAPNSNNPLKFSPNASEALRKMLESNAQLTYLDTEAAFQQAIRDLKQHQLAMLEGMRAAVTAVVAQFNPDELERVLEESAPLVANLPGARQARLWAIFEATYNRIREEAIDDFNDLFSKEFRKAYERLNRSDRVQPDF